VPATCAKPGDSSGGSQATAWKIKSPDGAAKKPGLNPGTLSSRLKKLGIQRPHAH
jgi:hypothetical protein